ncbi:hypothetical protein FACS189419_02670 [Planctomycetales bacterium]|nr:hypothetical protein FACS189419_02670 [Planctomycetales bacterium]
MKYDPSVIEPKWQQYWEKNKTFETKNGTNEKKKYVLDMFPYPSANGLHVGHPEGYTATDIVCRYERMNGTAVLHPMGWDAFGLPAEQQAKKTGVPPRTITETNIANFRRQLKMLGFSYDWSREVSTTDPAYFKWTQYIFLLLYNTWYDLDRQQGRPIDELPIPDDVTDIETYRDEHRLAYQIKAPVNWCPALGTVLANEEVISGRSERGNHPVIRMPLRQWMLRITAYADRLESDLEGLDWSEGIKALQRNWIGRSVGAEVDFLIAASSGQQAASNDWKIQRQQTGFPRKPGNDVLRIYTTRPDTLFGATYMVIAPEHPFVERLTTAEQKEAVEAYRQQAATKSDLDRTDLAKEKTGVFTGAYAVNPVNGQSIPIWVADYVLASYGTGAIMAVPAHDTRDFEFAKQFHLPIVQVVGTLDSEQHIGVEFSAFIEHGKAINSGQYNGILTAEFKERITEDLTQAGLGRKAVNYKLRDWLFSRQHFWGEPFPILHELEPPNAAMERVENRLRQKCEQLAVPLIRIPFSTESFEELFGKEHTIDTPIGRIKIGANQFEKLQLKDRQELLGAMKQTLTEPIVIIKEIREEGLSNLFIKSFRNADGESFYFVMSVVINREGVMISVSTHRRKNKQIFQKIESASPADIVWEVPMPTGQGQHGYSVNSPDSPQNSQENDTAQDELYSQGSKSQDDDYSKWKMTGRTIALSPEELPLDMPKGLQFDAAHNSPEPPLELAPKDWLYVERNGKKYKRETNTMPQWAGSCWYYLRFIDPKNDKQLVNPELEKQWMPVDLYVGGAEHAVLHLLYARFWHKVLYDYGLVSQPEPFQKLVNQGMILGEDGQKMSKSRGNVINPDDVVAKHGADSLRLYEMFMGPLESVKPWSMDSVNGVRGFLDRTWRMIVNTEDESPATRNPLLATQIQDIEPTAEQNRVLHKTIKAVSEDICNMSFNTAIARMMEFVNFFLKEKVRPRSAMEKFVLLLAPFAPHIAEELWSLFGHQTTLTYEPFPPFDAEAVKESVIEIPVSINGKLRSKIVIAADADESAMEQIAASEPKIVELLQGKTIIKKIIVRSKMVNFVVK